MGGKENGKKEYAEDITHESEASRVLCGNNMKASFTAKSMSMQQW